MPHDTAPWSSHNASVSVKALRSPAVKKRLLWQWPAIKRLLNLCVHGHHTGWRWPGRRNTARNGRFSPTRDVPTSRRKQAGGLSGAQDPLCDEVPRVALGPHVGCQGCGDAGIVTPGSGSWGHNPLGAILGKPRSPEGCLSSGDAVRTVGPMGCYGQRRAGGPRLRVGTDLSVCEPSPLELTCPALR